MTMSESHAYRPGANKHVMTDNPNLKAVIPITNPARGRVHEFGKRSDS